GALPPRTPAADLVGLGRHREQPPRPLLHAHARRPPPRDPRAGIVATDLARHRPGAARDGGVMGRRDDRLNDEMAFHLEQQIAKLVRGGMPETEARRVARLKFGGVERTREWTRDEFRGAWLRDAFRDLR